MNATMSFRIVDEAIDQRPTVPIEDPSGYPLICGWDIKAKAGPMGIQVDVFEECTDPARIWEMRSCTLFAAWTDLAGDNFAVADVRRLIRAEVKHALASMDLYDPDTELPQ